MLNLIPEVKSEKVIQQMEAMQLNQQIVDESEVTVSATAT